VRRTSPATTLKACGSSRRWPRTPAATAPGPPEALSLWLVSGAPPAEIAASAGHSVRVPLTGYAHCMPSRDQIASQQIEQALRPSQWAPCWPTRTGADAGNPVRHASVPQLDSTGHSWT